MPGLIQKSGYIKPGNGGGHYAEYIATRDGVEELKPGGYQRFTQIGEILERFPFESFSGVDSLAVNELARSARHDKYHLKDIKPLPRRKLTEKVPLLDCFTAPCEGGCPIRQDIPEYIELCRKGAYASALRLITEKNPLPFITGTICAHNCMTKCMRNYYDEPVNIRATKLVAAEKGYDAYMSKITPPAPVTDGRKVAVIGGGPTGMSAAYFVGRAGIPVTLFEKADRLGGIVRQVIPAFRISDEAIDKDVALIEKMGVEVKLNTEAPSVAELKAQGYTHIFFAVGAWKAGRLDIPGNVVPVIGWLRDMKAGKDVSLGHVAVVGGGNTAMDAARAALRAGAKSSTLVYRRTKKYMPADAEELEMAIADGVDAIIPIATTAAQIAALSAEETKTPVVYAAVSDPETAKLRARFSPGTASPWTRRASPPSRPISRASTPAATPCAGPPPWWRALPTPSISPMPSSARPTSLPSPPRP